MHRQRMWIAVDGLPLYFVAEKDGCGARRPEFFGKENQGTSADTHPYTRPHLRWGCWLLHLTEKEDHYG